MLVGRLYLFGESIDFPLGCDGDVVVELFNETPGAEPLLLERWQIDKATMKRVQHKDIVGWGYNLILPWGTYKPEITQVRMKVAYEAGKGMPVYTENVITVNSVQEYQIGVKTSPGTTTSFTPASAAQGRRSRRRR